VPGRGGIDDHVVVRGRRREPVQLHQADQLVHAGQRQREETVDVVFVEIRSACGDRA